jgi:hypothetical protein
VEADEDNRKEYQELINNIKPENLVYIDESGIDMSICKDKGWGKRGKKLGGKKSGKYYKRSNIIAGYANKKIIASLVFYGSCNSSLF